MKSTCKILVLGAAAAALLLPSAPALATDLSSYVGYTIVWAATVAGFQDRGKRPQDSFEGCDYDRRLILDDRYSVYCTGYSYTYSYRPEAAVLSNGTSAVLIVGGQPFPIRLR